MDAFTAFRHSQQNGSNTLRAPMVVVLRQLRWALCSQARGLVDYLRVTNLIECPCARAGAGWRMHCKILPYPMALQCQVDFLLFTHPGLGDKIMRTHLATGCPNAYHATFDQVWTGWPAANAFTEMKSICDSVTLLPALA